MPPAPALAILAVLLALIKKRSGKGAKELQLFLIPVHLLFRMRLSNARLMRPLNVVTFCFSVDGKEYAPLPPPK